MRALVHQTLGFLFLILGVVSFSTAQRSNGLAVEGKVTVQEGNVDGAVIQMFEDGRRLDNYGIGSDGSYNVELNYGHKFELLFTLKGNFPQKIAVDTNLPRNVAETNPSYPPFPVDINLFTEISGIDKSFSENTVQKIYYSSQVGNFISDLYYNDAQIKNLIDQAILQSQMIDKEEDYLSRLTRAELAELRKEYDQLLKEADDEYGNEKFLDALDGYKAANQVFPNEQYPKDRIAEINDLLGIMMVAEEMDKALAERFNTLVANADQFFNAQKYFEARNSYNRALSIRPEDSHASQRVREIDEILNAWQTEQQYQDLIVRGNNAYNEMLYDEALKIFTDASNLKPDESYPKLKIGEINEKQAQLAKNIENQANYEQAIFQAKLNFEKQFYDRSLASYENALKFKPGDEKATNKIKEIKDLMNSLANRTLYDKLIDSADKAYKKDSYQDALADYQKALEILPEEEHPKERIALIQQALQAEADFLAVIQKADEAFDSKQYSNSKNLYNQALELRASDKYSRDRIKEINELLAGMEVDEQYNSIIADADQLFTGQKYNDAKNKYTEALALKSKEQYPRDKINEINDLLRNIAAQDQQYNQTIDRADNLYGRENYREAQAVYAEARTMKPEETYPTEMIQKINKMLADQARLVAEKEAAEQARLEALALERDQRYQATVDEADRLVDEDELVAAVGKFRAALDIKPEEQYPIVRIEEIRGIISQMQEMQKAYDEIIANADKAYQREEFDTALSSYISAKNTKSDETYPDEMITKIDSIVESRARIATEAEAAEQARLAAIQAKKDSLYNVAVASADEFFNNEDYENARTAYRSALDVKPEETYARQRIEDIGTILAQQSAAQKAFEDAVKQGDSEFRREEFDAARTAFTNAKSAKPGETYPDEMIAKIDSIVETRARLAAEAQAAEQARLAAIQAENDSLYVAAIESADNFFNNEAYENAITAYRSALEVKPGEAYPQQQIEATNQRLEEMAVAQREMAALNRNYENVIQTADNFLRSQSYAEAKVNYEKALALKPGEEYPAQKMAGINDILQQQKVDEQYRNAIVAADGFFKTESYTEAKVQYQKAMEIKPEEQYPSSQMSKIDEYFRQEQERALAEQMAAADLERRRNEIQQMNKDNREIEITSEAGLNALYDEYIQNADSYFENADYNTSRGWYYQAWELKPEENYPRERIAEINQLVGNLLATQRDRDYQGFIDLADSTFRDNQLAVSRGWYNRALSVKPNEIYPKNQLNEIQRKIKERLANQSGEIFNSNVEKAAEALETQNFSVARFWYKKALELQPDAQDVKDKLAEIEEALKN